MAAIVGAVNEKKDHIPPVVSSQAVTFPFEIAIRGCGACRRACLLDALEPGFKSRAWNARTGRSVSINLLWCFIAGALAAPACMGLPAVASVISFPPSRKHECTPHHVPGPLPGCREGGRHLGLDTVKRLLMHSTPPPVLQ